MQKNANNITRTSRVHVLCQISQNIQGTLAQPELTLCHVATVCKLHLIATQQSHPEAHACVGNCFALRHGLSKGLSDTRGFRLNIATLATPVKPMG